MIIIPASDIIQTNYYTYDGTLPTSYSFDGDFSNIQLIGFNANNFGDRGINLAPVTHAYPYNLIVNTIPEEDQGETWRSSSVNTTKGTKLKLDYDNYLEYRDKSSALIIVIVYDINNDQWVNLSNITSLDIQKAKQAAIPVYCYVYNDKPTCSSIYQIGTENTATIAVFSYYNSGAVIIDESGTVTVYLANHSGGVE